jgi:hypothetical protein
MREAGGGRPTGQESQLLRGEWTGSQTVPSRRRTEIFASRGGPCVLTNQRLVGREGIGLIS